MKTKLKWKNDLTFEQLSESLNHYQSIVSVKARGADFGHALIVDAIINAEVRLRDSLPVGQGKSYAVSIVEFKEVWLRENNVGSGIIYDKPN